MDNLCIKDLREKLGITQEEFAYRLGVAVSTVARWEGGKFNPSKMARKGIERVFSETAKELITK